MLVALCWVAMIPMASATFWTSVSYVAGEDFSLARRAKRQKQQQHSQVQQEEHEDVLELEPEPQQDEVYQLKGSGKVKPVESSAAPSATPRRIHSVAREEQHQQRGVQDEVVEQQNKKSAGQEACTAHEDAAMDTVTNTAAATNKAATTRKGIANSLSEPTTLDTVPVVSSMASVNSNASNSLSRASIILAKNEKQQKEAQQPKVSPAGVTRYILVSAVLALSLLNIHLYISL
jgi:hypothetical protein